MKLKSYFFIAPLFALISCVSDNNYPNEDSLYASYAPDGIPFVVSDSLWEANMFGNHRAVINVNEGGVGVVAELKWRRPDLRPESKKIRVIDAATGDEIKNIKVDELTNEKGIITFQPQTVPGDYLIYYMPYTFRKGWNDARYGKPWNDYLPPVYDEVDSVWIKKLNETSDLPHAAVKTFESRSKFDYFTSMGNTATQAEMDSIAESLSMPYALYTEDRAFPIRLTDKLPVRWINRKPLELFEGQALQNEYYVWQVGVWAIQDDLKNVRLQFEDLVHSNNKDRISKEEITCFNQEGIDWDGKSVTFTVDVPEKKIQALWCGIQIPENAKPGTYTGKAIFTADNQVSRPIDVTIHVVNEKLADKGDSELWRHARLRWLNSRIGDDNLPVTPYVPMLHTEYDIKATDKLVRLEKNGLPQSIIINDRELLSEPIQFVIETSEGVIPFEADNLKIDKEADGLVVWSASSNQNGISFICEGYMEYDGYIRYHVKLKSDRDIKVKDVKLITAYRPESSDYFMGISHKGGLRPNELNWNWKGPWDSYWIGSDKSGLHVEFRGGDYHGPLLNDYKPAPPSVWYNNGKGSIKLNGNKNEVAKVVASTGENKLSSNQQDFEFALLITPVKPVDSKKHFSERYFHSSPENFDKAAEEGANIANIHHARSLNPVINYPFIVQDSLIDFIQSEHEKGRKVKLYYTIRELTNYVHEIYALKSLNHEIFQGGPGYGLPWHCEHLIDDYRPAWYTELPNETSDAALVLSGFSRWINYYLEGLRWMYENYELDGIYMDDVSFDRNVMKRMKKISSQYRPDALVDLHSNTWYSVGPMNQYADFFPYVDRLWFGESFKYNEMTPDEWFVTFSGSEI